MDQSDMDYLICRFKNRGLEPTEAQLNLYCKLLDTYLAGGKYSRPEARYRAFWQVAKL